MLAREPLEPPERLLALALRRVVGAVEVEEEPDPLGGPEPGEEVACALVAPALRAPGAVGVVVPLDDVEDVRVVEVALRERPCAHPVVAAHAAHAV